MKRTGLLPFGQLPIIDFDGFQLVQSKAIIRYIARLKGLYGCDAKEGALCDMISEALTDVNVLASAWFYSTEDKRPVVEANYESVLPSWLAYFENLLKTSHHKSYFVGDRLTYADILVFDWLDKKNLDLSNFPLLANFRIYMASRPKIAKYLSARAASSW